MSRTKDRNADLEERSRVHAARIEDLEDELAAAQRRVRTLEAERQAQAGIIRRRNEQQLVAAEVMRRQALAYLALSRVRDTLRPAPGPIDTGTPGVYAAVSPR